MQDKLDGADKSYSTKSLSAQSLVTSAGTSDNRTPAGTHVAGLFGLDGTGDRPADASEGIVALDEVLQSVDVHFPALLAARQKIAAAEGAILAASGNFDTTLNAATKHELDGFYQKDIFDLLVEQPTAVWGATFFAGYRLGIGDFADYEKGLQTQENGEFRLGLTMPLLQGRDIDRARFDTWKAEIKRNSADPEIHDKRVEVTQKATHAYWQWVAAGQKVIIADDLLRLARGRRQSLAEGVLDGLFAEIILVENDGLIVARESARVAATREFERAAIRLSLYLRDATGEPRRTTLGGVPRSFPARTPMEVDPNRLIVFGLSNRPDARTLANHLTLARLDLELQENTLLPRLDASVFTSQDVGGGVSETSDKGPFELGVGLTFELPLGLRRARGMVMASRAEVDRLTYEAQFLEDRIEQDIRDALSAVERSAEQIDLAEQSVELALKLEQAERIKLDEGTSDLVVLNLREQATAKARSEVIEVQESYFSSLATFRAALGLPQTGP